MAWMSERKKVSWVSFFCFFFPGPLCLAAACHDAMFRCCVGARPPFLGMLCTPGGFLNNYGTWARRVPHKAAANLERWFGGASEPFYFRTTRADVSFDNERAQEKKLDEALFPAFVGAMNGRF